MGMVRASESAHRSLKEVAEIQGVPMRMVLDEAIESHRRRIFLEKLNEDFAALKADPDAWREELDERAL